MALVLTLASGCRTNCNTPRSPCDPAAPGRAPWPGTDIPRAPFPAGTAAPAPPPGGALPPPPAPVQFQPQTGQFQPQTGSLGTLPNTMPNALPNDALAQGWQPSRRINIQLGAPQISEQRDQQATRFYGPPNPPSSPSPPSDPSVNLQASNPKKPLAPSVLPVGIPQFAQAKDQVANGLRPLLDDGLDWLETNQYKTVLHLRLPGEEDNADRKQVEKRGLKYVSLEVSPQTLSPTVVESFNRVVNDASLQPLFIYDRDGALTGALWYLHFRTAEQAADETARVRASSLGLREDREGTHRAMWLAAQNFVESTPCK